ncbi:DUF6443 domain-containing protein, partial [Aquimarina sediminis]|uniref:DUF6443 domain-containing protein n=1 Tax=Aquimarina sediminis TaxID=2070536 RepID=UPI001F4DFB15
MQKLYIYICCLFFIAPCSGIFAQQIHRSNENHVLKVSAQQEFKTVTQFENAPLDQKVASITYYDGLGRPKQSIAIGASPVLSSATNQLQMDWTAGTGGTSFFNQNGQTSENQREIGGDPTGAQSLLWKCGNDPQNDGDGGWNTDYFDIDNTVGYRYSVWVKRTGSQDGETYHGTQNVTDLNGGVHDNPYFWYGDLPQLNTWYLIVGVIHPHNYTGGDQGISGVYDTNGNRVLDGREFKWNSTKTNSRFRSYLYYSTNTSVRQYFWNPMVQKLDGSQSKIADLNQQETPRHGDIIAHTEYDGLGRQSKQYLPFTKNGELGSYRKVDTNKDINTYYLTAYADDFAGITNPEQVNAYAETIHEQSPLGRTKEVAAPGAAWKYIEGDLQYENPVYTYFPTTVSYDKFWEAQDIFYIEGENNLPSQYQNGDLLLNNYVNFKIENGTLTVGVHTTAPNGGTHKLPLGKLRHIPISHEIKNIDLGVLKDADGNFTDYRLGIQDNYLTITPTRSNPRPVSKGIHQMFNNKITYDLTQIQYVTYQNVYRSKPDSHTVKSEHDLNNATDVLRFDVVMVGGDSKNPSLVANGHYAAGQLTKSIVKNENWKAADGTNNTVVSFTDKNGRVVLSKAYNGAQELDTYNVYDDFGNLTYVIPPKVTPGDGISTIEMEELMYQYRYDERNRLIEKKTPGMGWEYIVYNQFDQPVMTQDAGLRKENSGKPWDQWLFIKYDTYGRVAYTGVALNGSTRKVLQNRVNSDTYQLYESKSATPITIGGTTVYYTKAAYPTSMYKIHTINYYDDYVFDIPAGLANPGTVYGVPITSNTKTLPTGSKVRILDTNDWITTVTYYDKKARAVYAASKNDYLSTTDIVETEIDFVGKVIQSKTTHTKGSNTPIVTIDSFTYDHQGRVLTQTQKINGQTPVVIAANRYDKMGQVTAVEVGGGLQTVDYKYNIRGWLKTINNGTTDNGDLFGYAINYMTPTENLGATGVYNGNISEITWQTASDHTKRGYGYQYDALNRLTTATSTDGRYTLSGITYDKMGNIMTLNRQGHTNAAATTFGAMDHLTYTYNEGNKLLKVTDTAHKTYGFKDGTNTGNDYEYDYNGSMTIDRNKGITNITYNHMDLPLEITFDNSSSKKINYVYDATGSKLKKTVTDGLNTTVTEYAGGAQYKNGTLEFIPHAGGYIEPSATGFKYTYQYTDHLGNVRLSYTDRDNSGTITNDEIVEENNYYPFGLQQKGY